MIKEFEEAWTKFLTDARSVNPGIRWHQADKALAEMFFVLGQTDGLRRAINVTQEVMLSNTEGRLNG